MIVYIGSPIDTSKGSPTEAFISLARIIKEVTLLDCLIFNPLSAWHNAENIQDPTHLKHLIDTNTRALESASLGVFVWNDSPSYGVPVEIELCAKKEIPAIVWNQSEKRPGIYLRHAVHKSGGAIVSSEEDLRKAIKKEHDDWKSADPRFS